MAAHAVVILAAGGSRRLGQPKQLLTRSGETLLRRTVRLAAMTRPARLVVVLGADAGRLADELADIAHQAVINPDWNTGLAGSLRAAGPHVDHHDTVLVLSCDQPALELHHLETLLAGATRAGSGCAATDLDGRPGIPAAVPGAWFGEIHEESIDASRADRGFRTRLRGMDLDALHLLHAPELLRDIDTPDDLIAARGTGLLDG